ncbi:hypothetical protein J7U46_02450 [Pelomonas sp. V22]|uniref:hypothetical protein n=1 Tax=Pelomonas sp. V22 TaxID=2822139 RepID=UPI0024A844BB|nr:hypothetical protein [Pelomonas sp. V22]MDI4631901.1 hypothetical protein [Pelomonas sp. V22]
MATTTKSRRKAEAALVEAPLTVPETLHQDAIQDAVQAVTQDPVQEPPPEVPAAAPAAKKKATTARKPPAKKTPRAAKVAPPRFGFVARPAEGALGRYVLSDSQADAVLQLDVHGDGVGDYRCNCAPFAASDEGSCEHSQFLLEQIGDTLTTAPAPAFSEIWLAQGLQRRLRWRAGETAPEALCEAAEDLFGESASLDAEQGQRLDPLLDLAAELGHELRVAPEVWEQLSHAADARERLARLEAAMAEGADLQQLAGLRQPLPEFQWEAALFALCAGRSLLADDLGLGHRAATLAALQLWRRLFGLGSVVLLAAEERHAAWRADAEAWLGGWPEGVQLLQQGEAPLADAELLIVDGVQQLETLPLVPTTHLLLLADRELLGEPLLGEMVAWLDLHRRGPWALWHKEAAAASKRQQRELLQSVMLSRRKRDLLPRLPETLDQRLWSAESVALDQDALAQLRQLQARWQSQRYLGASEQLRLMTALQVLRQSAQSPAALAIKSGQLLKLLPQIIPAAAQRVAVFAQQDASVQALAAALRAEGLAVAELLLAQSPEQRQGELDAWRGDEGLLLLASDAACAGLDLQHEQVALVHADQPWNPVQRDARARRLNGETGRGLPIWHLMLTGSFDAVQSWAQAGRAALPAGGLDYELGARPFLAAADLALLMDALASAGA